MNRTACQCIIPPPRAHLGLGPGGCPTAPEQAVDLDLAMLYACRGADRIK